MLPDRAIGVWNLVRCRDDKGPLQADAGNEPRGPGYPIIHKESAQRPKQAVAAKGQGQRRPSAS